MKTQMPLISIFLLLFISKNAQAQQYVLDWLDHKSFTSVFPTPTDNPSGYPAGALVHDLTEIDQNVTPLEIGIRNTGNTDALAVVNNFTTPLAYYYYQGVPNYVIAVDMPEMLNGEEVVTNFFFSEPNHYLTFTIFDLDSNTASDNGPDRDEQLTIFGYDENNNIVYPTLISHDANTITGSNNHIAQGVIDADFNSPTGNIDVIFDLSDQPIELKSIELHFSLVNADPNSTSGQPGYGIGNMSFGNIVQSVDLSSFSIETSLKYNQISWTTESETDNDHFEVQRSYNGTDFTTIATIQGKGNTTERTTYYYGDYQIVTGKAYYRLKQVDTNGEFTYSDVIAVDQKGVDFDILTFNRNALSILSAEEGSGHLKLYKNDGQCVYNKDVAIHRGNQVINLAGSNVKAGVYIVELSYDNNRTVKQFVVQ